MLKDNKLVLITGPPQSGKSTLIETLVTEDIRKHIRIYVTEQLDTKSLLGNYICGEKVGEFEWREGPLSSIVKSGGILILENFQEAKDELIELTLEILNDNFRVRGDKVHIKESFRVICAFTTGNEQLMEKLEDVQKATSQAVVFKKNTVTFNDIMKRYPVIASNSLTSTILYDLQKIIDSCNRDLKSEIKCTIIDSSNFIERVNSIYVKTFGSENPIHFSINFKLSLMHLFYDIIIAKFRQQIPDSLLDRLGDAFKITGAEIKAYIESYTANLNITDESVISKRYGKFYREDLNADWLEGGATIGKRGKVSVDFFKTSLVANLVEAILGSCKYKNSMLLVGEAGCGKTTIVQETAGLLGKVLHVYNMSQSSDVSDLIGGFKPLNSKTYIAETADEFCQLLRRHFDYTKNIKLVSYLRQLIAQEKSLLALAYMVREVSNICAGCKQKSESDQSNDEVKRTFRRKHRVFDKLFKRLETVLKLRDKLESSLIFKFIQGNLVNALREGQWILLDEINLASPEVLQNILPILEHKSIILIEKGELKEVDRHPDFKLFACMNPGNSVGKKELPPLIRKNFIEYFVDELEDAEELTTIIKNRSRMQFQEIEYQRSIKVYLSLRDLVNRHLVTDGFNRKPTISLRALSRAISIAMTSWQMYATNRGRAMVEGLYAALSSNLSTESKAKFENLICETFQIDKEFLPKAERNSAKVEKPGFVNIEGFLLKLGSLPPKDETQTDFLMTGSVRRNLIELLRVVAHSSFPILLEGPTSAGKTSMIKYLGERSGNKVVRINNHQHTDLDEYIGTYSPDETGRLVFKEGLLVEAMRKGYWIILDELNLARSEILEALNRLLDDNRELFVPEINEVIVPHSDFRIFATQNPLDYGGRKELSIAFRSRFFHFFIRDIEDEDLVKIIETRCQVPASRSKKLVDIMKQLRVLRSRQNIFAGKESFITIRDLIKWASRDIIEMDQLALNGYCLLAERLRYESERSQVHDVLTKLCLKSDQVLDPSACYASFFKHSTETLSVSSDILNSVFWSKSFTRMYSLVIMSLEKSEPVLLIGETGSGKTTIAELVAKIYQTQLYTVNCHQFTESSDFLGGLRPVRGKDKAVEQIRQMIHEMVADMSLDEEACKELELLSDKASTEERIVQWELCLKVLKSKQVIEETANMERAIQLMDVIRKDLDRIGQMFQWIDGPLVQAMISGGVLLIDEISLAQDSVLERLNSVLEKEKTIVISEKGDGSVQELIAHKNFMIIATMNPSGDYGKKELTPALRNRFTEIWVEPVTNPAILSEEQAAISKVVKSDDLEKVPTIKNDFINFVLKELQRLEQDSNFKEGNVDSSKARAAVCLFVHKLTSDFNNIYGSVLKPLTIRDIKSTLPFLLKNITTWDNITPNLFKDYIQMVLGGFKCLDKAVASAAIQQSNLIADDVCMKFFDAQMKEENLDMSQESDIEFKIGHYSVIKQIIGHKYEDLKYSVEEDTVKSNLKTILMAMSMDKAIMLEGPPGVGKTSLIQFLARKVGTKFYRVNLNEQTDMIDLLGSDVPSSSSSIFSWADGVLIQAMKEGAWLLLDELNMATQTVLEGLNSILDHRGSIYLPELDKTIYKHPRFRIFASQNPMSMGSGRKGLPHSFITRFTRVWIEELSESSLQSIIHRIYSKQLSSIPHLSTLVAYFFKVKSLLSSLPSVDNQWEFNLRDLHKMVQFIEIGINQQSEVAQEEKSTLNLIQKACNLSIMARIDNDDLRTKLRDLFRKTFSGVPFNYSLSLGKDSSEILPQHLHRGNISGINRIVEEPLSVSLDSVIQASHPALFLFRSRSKESVLSIESVVSNLAIKHNSATVKRVSLFGSSDLIDLIGSYEQVNPSEMAQLSAEKRFKGLISCDDAESAEKTENDIKMAIHQCFKSSKTVDTLFSWRESELCSAIRRGDWVILKGAELVNPAILERLNGLLEEDEIFINEALGTEESIEHLKKSSKFRIFVLYDLSKAKQIPSRALRNRCIEINLSNFEFDSEESKPSAMNLIPTVTSSILFPYDSSDADIMKCEDYSRYDRANRSLAAFDKNFTKMLATSANFQEEDLTGLSLAQIYQLAAKHLRKAVQDRCNFQFGKKTTIAPAYLAKIVGLPYQDCLTSGDNTRPLLDNFVKRHYSGILSSVFNDPKAIKELWHQAFKSIGADNEENLIGDITEIEENSDQYSKLLFAYWLLVCGKTRRPEKWVKPFKDMVNAQDRQGLQGSETEVIRDLKLLTPQERNLQMSGGFLSPVTLCLNIVYGYLLTKSTSFAGVLDRSSDTRKSKTQSTGMWQLVSSVLDKNQVLKLQIVDKALSTKPLIKQVSSIVQASLSSRVSVDESALAELLQLVLTTIDESFIQVMKSVSNQFIDYDMLEEVTNTTSHRFVFKPKSDQLDLFLSFLASCSVLEQLKLEDREFQLASHCAEEFEALNNLQQTANRIGYQLETNISINGIISSIDNKTSESQESKASVSSYIDTLACYYKADDSIKTAVHLLMKEGSRRELIRLASEINQLNHGEYKVSDWDCIQRLDSKLRNWHQEGKIQGQKSIPELEESIYLNLTDVLTLECSDTMKLLEIICVFAENPNQNTIMSMLVNLKQVLVSEWTISEARIKADEAQKYDSIFNHEAALRKINDVIEGISKQLKSQKTRQLSRYQFESATLAEGSQDGSLTYFITEVLFKILSKNTAFLADSDVQAMKKIKNYCSTLEVGWRIASFDELQGIISDSYILLQNFINSGQLITFGDFLIPFFGISTQILFSARHHLLSSPVRPPTESDLVEGSPAIPVIRDLEYPHLDNVRHFRQSLKDADTLPASVCHYLALPRQLANMQAASEIKLMAATQQLARDTAIGRGRSFDEAGRLRNLQKGVERTVKDEYNKEVVELNKAEEKFEIKRIFGIEAELMDDPRFKEAMKYDSVRVQRKEHIMNILDGTYMVPKDKSQVQPKNKDLLERSIFSLISMFDSSRIDTTKINEASLYSYYCQILRKDIIRETTTGGQRDVRKSMMLEQPNIDTIDQFEVFWIAQMKQFAELENNSFYRGRCIDDLVKLRPTIFELLDKVQELRQNEDLRELPSFNNIVAVADHLLSLLLKKATLNEVCLLLEKLSNYVLDYESITPRRYHFPDLKIKLRDALYEYRQIERKSWRGLIFCQGLDQILDDLDDCIQLKNVILDEVTIIEADPVVIQEKTRKLLDLVDTFLVKTSLLKQLFRLFWISRIIRCLPSSPTLPEFKHLALHLLRYHMTFLPSVLQLYTTNFSAVGEPIKENEKLSNWHMKDLVNMKMNVNKFHKGVQRAMKAHKEVLEISTEGTIYKFRRDAYLAKEIGPIKVAITQPEDIREENKKEPKVLGKGTIDKIKAKPEYVDETIAKLLTMNLRLFRLVKVQDWLPIFGEKPTNFAYKNYESALTQCEFFISDWITTLDDIKDSKSRSNRLRVLDGYMKLLHSMGIRERHSIENWDSIKTFSFCTNPVDADVFTLPLHKKQMTKVISRAYEMVDILFVNKSNMAYHTDIQPQIRKRLQGYMMNMAGATMDMIKKFSRAIRMINEIRDLVARPNIGSVMLTDKDRVKFDADIKRYEVTYNRIESGGFSSTEKMQVDSSVYLAMKAFSEGNLSLNELNCKLLELGYPRTYKPASDALLERSDASFLKAFSKFQSQLSKDISSYDLLTKSKLFQNTIPSFMASLPSRLLQMRALTRKHRLTAVCYQCDALLCVIVEHLVQSASAFARWNWMGCRVLHSLIYSGLCVAKDDDQEQEEGSEEYEFGTGVGEGKGDENQTGKYEFEEQVLGEKGGQDDDDMKDDEASAHESQAQSEDEAGGESMEVDHEDKGMEDNGKKDEDRKENEDDDQAMSDVDDGDVDQDLWDKENEAMDEESQESEERREDEEREYDDKQKQQEEEGDQRAKQPDSKEHREANDFEAQSEEEKADDEKPDEEKYEEEKDAKKDEDEYAEVESRSAMSSRNENENMDFDKDQEEAPEEDVENQEDQNDDFEIDEEGKDENKEDEMDEENPEDFDDPLQNKEKQIKEEENDNNAGEKDENQDNVQDAGLNPQADEEVQENTKKEENIPQKDKKSKNSKNAQNQKTEKTDNQDLQEAEEEQMNEEETKNPEETKVNQELSKETKAGIEDAPEQQKPKNLDISNDRLASMLERMLKADDAEDDQEDGELEGLAEGEGAEVRVKKQTGDQKLGRKKQENDAVQIKNELDMPQQPHEEKNDEQKDEKMQVEDEVGDQEKDAKDGNEDHDVENDEDADPSAPQKRLKVDDEDDFEEQHMTTLQDVKHYIELLNDDEHHLSSSNHSWTAIEPLLRTRAYNLCEELRNIFKPTKIAGLKGDFRTGKRLNMRKVISYVASNYRKDKIWLRRSDPSQRDYEIALAIDDTLSMSEKNVGYLALESLIILALALSKLEVGKINISGIRTGLHEVLPFAKPFIHSDGQRIIDNFTFTHSDKQSADIGLPAFLNQISEKFTPGHSGKILIVINDGKCNKTLVAPVLRGLEEEGVMVVNVILDRKNEKSSVLNMRSTTFDRSEGISKVKLTQYMDDYPFSKYVIVQDTAELTSVLVSIMRECIGRD